MGRKLHYFFKICAIVALIIAIFPFAKHNQAYAYSIPSSCNGNNNVDIVFVFDNSGSMNETDPGKVRFKEAQNMMDKLNQNDRGSIVAFDENASTILSLTSDRDEFKQGITRVPDPASGGTDMSTGLEAAMKEMDVHSHSNQKYIVVLTDGMSINTEKALNLAQQAYDKKISIFTIGLGDSINIPEDFLKKIAQKTDGQYYHSAASVNLTAAFTSIFGQLEEKREPRVYSDWVLQQDLHVPGDLVINENTKLDLNGYDLTVDGTLVPMSCSIVRGVNGTIKANNLENKPDSTINLNNSRLKVDNQFTQNGILRVNGKFEDGKDYEIEANGPFTQKNRGTIDLNGRKMKFAQDALQEGWIQAKGGTIDAQGKFTQSGRVDLDKGHLNVAGDLIVNGGPLVDDHYENNRSLNVGGGFVTVGSEEKPANLIQNSGQLFVNHGFVTVNGNYTLNDGWLTMIYGKGGTRPTDPVNSDGALMDEGDFVDVKGDFTTRTKRNHAERNYTHLGKPMDDQGHLTDGILRVGGQFHQYGDKEYHPNYSDKYTEYKEDYSRYGFAASGRHRVILTGKSPVEMEGQGSKFNILELDGSLPDYSNAGKVHFQWNTLVEASKSANVNLKSIKIDDVAVPSFQPSVLNYQLALPDPGISNPLRQLKVEAIPEDRNAKVTVVGDNIGDDGTATVKILVTALDGKTTKMYTVNVSTGESTSGQVSGVTLSQKEFTFLYNSAASQFSPADMTLGYTVTPSSAANKDVTFESSNESVATVSANGVVIPKGEGTTTITVKTVDGHFTDSANISVINQGTALRGIKNVEDLISNQSRFDALMNQLDLSKLYVVVPHKIISAKISADPYSIGKIKTDDTVDSVTVKIDGETVQAKKVGMGNFEVIKFGVKPNAYIEYIARNSAGDELERVSWRADVLYEGDKIGYYTVRDFLENPNVFQGKLNTYPLDNLKIEYQGM